MLAALTGIIFALSFTAILTQPANNAQAQQHYAVDIPEQDYDLVKHTDKILHVTGVATANTSPDLLVLQFGVETQEKTAKQALDSNSKLMNAIVESIKNIGVTEDEISTSRFNIHPVYEGYDVRGIWKEKFIGYNVVNSITVETTNLDSAANIIDNAVDSGANKVDSIFFTISSEKETQIKNDLIEQAILDAKFKAEKALKPLDYKIIGVMGISISDFDTPAPFAWESDYAFSPRSMASAKYAPTPIFDSDQEISKFADVIFLIDQN
jgi:uncharacterized protein YggE